MTILTTTTQTVPFTAPWREGDEGAPVFHLRGCDVIERGQMEAELAGKYRAGRVYGFELDRAIDGGIKELLGDHEDFGRLLELLAIERAYVIEVAQAAKEGRDEPPAPMSVEDSAMLAQVRDILSQHWRPYSELLEQAARRREIAPLVALQRFCANITGLGINKEPIVFKRGLDGLVTNATLSSIEQLELLVAGNRAYNLQYPDGDTEKN